MLRVWKNITNSELEKLRKEAVKEKDSVGPSMAVQGLRLHTSNTEGMGSNPGRGTKISHAIQHSLKKKKIKKK